MLDETQDAPEAEATDDAVDLADLGGDVQTADEPAVTAEELMDIPDAPATPGPEELAHVPSTEASEPAAPAAAEDAGDDADAAGDEDAGGEAS